MSAALRRLIKVVFQILSSVAPGMAGNLAFRLFCRPVKASNVTPVQRAMIPAAEKILSTATIQAIQSGKQGDIDAGTIQTYIFEPEHGVAGTTLLLHGWSSRATHMLAFVEPLLAQSQRVIAIDLPGHGQSSGRSFHLPKGIQAVHAVHQHFPAIDCIIAHSLGGAVATSLIAGSSKHYAPLSIKKLVLMSAPNSMPAIFQDFADMIGLNPAAKAVLDKNVIRLAGNPLEAFVGSEQIRQSSTPTLVLHDPADKELPIREAYALAEAGTLVTLKEIEEVGHRRILYSPAAVKLATDFVHPSTWRAQAEDSSKPDPVSI